MNYLAGLLVWTAIFPILAQEPSTPTQTFEAISRSIHEGRREKARERKRKNKSKAEAGKQPRRTKSTVPVQPQETRQDQ